MAAVGLTNDQMSAILKMSKRAFEQHCLNNPLVRNAVEEGRATALYKVGQTCYNMAVSGKNPAMTIFYLKCRGNWKPVNVIENREAPIESDVVIVKLPENGSEKNE